MSDNRLYRVALLPSAVFLSVIFGGSYGSGQEIVQFVTSAGPVGGYLSLMTVLLVWGLLLGTSFELARRFQTFEYSGFMAVLLARGAILYEITILLAMILVLAICASGSGTVLAQHFGLPSWVGSLGLLATAVLLNYLGRSMVERSMMLSIVALFAVLAVLFLAAVPDLSMPRDARQDWFSAVKSGGQYAIVNGGFIPLLLFCGRGVRSRGEAFAAGLIAAGAAVVPGIMLHTSFVPLLPSVLEQPLPAYAAIERFLPPLVLSAYVVVLFIMITQTAVGMVQGLTDRADAFNSARAGKPFSKPVHAALSAGVIIGAMLLAQIGFVALIAQGYDILVGIFIVIFVLPLLTLGLYKVFKST